jgi:lipopolysaccharide transport system permease protein
MAGLVPWTLFSSSLTFGVSSISSNQSMVNRLSFPRIVLPLSAIGLSLIDAAVSGLILIGLMIAMHQPLHVEILWVPVLLTIEVGFVTGLVLLLGALNVFARDVRLAVPLVTQLWLLVTPVMYPLDFVPASLKPWFLANPMTGMVESFRDVTLNGTSPQMDLLIPTIVGTAVTLALGSWYFSVTQDRFADVI